MKGPVPSGLTRPFCATGRTPAWKSRLTAGGTTVHATAPFATIGAPAPSAATVVCDAVCIEPPAHPARRSAAVTAVERRTANAGKACWKMLRTIDTFLRWGELTGREPTRTLRMASKGRLPRNGAYAARDGLEMPDINASGPGPTPGRA